MTRIVGGVAGGRRLQVPAGRRTRPTSERAREGLFSSLEALRGGLSGAGFLDLYAGSGAVGLEAASRGARPVLLVERDPAAVTALRANVAALALAEVAVRARPVGRLLAEPAPTSYDVVYLDPPYADDVADDLAQLVNGGWLAADAVVVVERSVRSPALQWPLELTADRTRRYGDTLLCYALWYGRRP
jgi:16S rRNA (guanine966-N2)-methyltransferase